MLAHHRQRTRHRQLRLLGRCAARIEPQDDTLEARKLIYDADQAFTAAQLVKSKQLYDEGLQKWREVLDAYPVAARTTPI